MVLEKVLRHMTLIEKRRYTFDVSGNAGAGFTDFLKTFDCINDDLMIAKFFFVLFLCVF